MVEKSYKADDMNYMNSMIIAADIKKAIEFYTTVFGFETRMTLPDKDGKITHAELTFHDCVLMMGAETDDTNYPSAKTLGGSPITFYLYVEDVDSFINKAKDAGAEVKQEPTDQFWGDRTCTLVCPEGIRWNFATKVGEFDPSKMPQ